MRDMWRIGRGMLVTAALLGGWSVSAAAAVKIVQISHTDGYTLGEIATPPKDTEIVTWVEKDRLLQDNGSWALIVDRGEGSVVLLDHAGGRFARAPLPFRWEEVDQSEMVTEVLTMLAFEIGIERSDDEKSILGLQSKRVDVTATSPLLGLRWQMWLTWDAPVADEPLQELFRPLYDVVFMSPMAELDRQLGGFAVEGSGEMSMQGVSEPIGTWFRTKSVTETDPPPGTFDVPESYEQLPFTVALVMEVAGR